MQSPIDAGEMEQKNQQTANYVKLSCTDLSQMIKTESRTSFKVIHVKQKIFFKYACKY